MISFSFSTFYTKLYAHELHSALLVKKKPIPSRFSN